MTDVTLAAAPTEAPPAAPVYKSPVGLSWIARAALLVALLLLNVAVARVVARVDLTEDRLYSITEASKAIVRKLDDPCRIRVYWSDNVPNTTEPARRRIEGLLDEYESASEGRVSVSWVSVSAPKKKKKRGAEGEDVVEDPGWKEATERGVQPTTFYSFEATEQVATLAMVGLTIAYESETEAINSLIRTEEGSDFYEAPTSLEYTITSTIYKMSRKDRPTIAYISDASPPSQMDFMNPRRRGGEDKHTAFAHKLESTFGNSLRRSVNLDDPVPADITTMVVLSPKDWSEKKVYHFEQFLLRGGKALLLVNPIGLETAANPRGMPAKSGLEDWLKSNGVEIGQGVVGDFDPSGHSTGMLRTGDTASLHWWVRALKDNIDQGNPAVRGFKSTFFYFPSEVIVDAAKQKEAGRTASTLVTTTAKGVRRESTFGLLEPTDDSPGDKHEKVTLMASISGKFTSYWKDKPAPDEPPPAPPAPPADAAMGEPAMGDAPMGEPAVMSEPAMAEAPMGEPAMTEPAMTEPPTNGGAAMSDAGMDAAKDAPKDAPKDAKDSAGMSSGDAPSPAPEGMKGPEGPEGEKPKDAKPPRLNEGSGTLVIVGDSDMVCDDFSGIPGLDQTGGITKAWNNTNGFFLMTNLVDWLTGGDDLMALRSRDSGIRKMDEIDPDTASGIRVANYIGAPIVLLIAGLLVFIVRRFRR